MSGQAIGRRISRKASRARYARWLEAGGLSIQVGIAAERFGVDRRTVQRWRTKARLEVPPKS